MGRTARGVRGIRLAEGDYVVACVLVDESKKLLTVTENGFGKRSAFEDFRTIKRGGKGVRVHGLNDKTGKLAAIISVGDEDDIVIIADNNQTIRTHAADISEYARGAGGVIVMRQEDGSRVTGVANVGASDEDDAEELTDGIEATEATEVNEAADVVSDEE
jgi:DNA gyrase subunit A